MIHLYRRLLLVRRASPALQFGTVTLLPSLEGVVAYRRTLEADCRTVVINFTGETISCAGAGTIEIARDGRDEGAPYEGLLRPDVALILRDG